MTPTIRLEETDNIDDAKRWQADLVRYKPHGNPRREEFGECSLCGFVGKLSKTHAPPRSAGNKGKTRYAVEQIDDAGISATIFSPRTRDGGMWGWWFCERCNHETERWDREFALWANEFAPRLTQHPPRSAETFYLYAEQYDPAAFVRALWSWSLAVDVELRHDVPDVAAAVLTGEPVTAPTDHRMLLGATTDLRICMAMQRGGVVVQTHVGAHTGWHKSSTGLLVPGPELLPVPRIAISAPPFVALLAHANDDTQARYFDTGDWLEENVGARRTITAVVPAVRPFIPDGNAKLVRYEELAA